MSREHVNGISLNIFAINVEVFWVTSCLINALHHGATQAAGQLS
jgi:hypothetical protein